MPTWLSLWYSLAPVLLSCPQNTQPQFPVSLSTLQYMFAYAPHSTHLTGDRRSTGGAFTSTPAVSLLISGEKKNAKGRPLFARVLWFGT